MTRSKLWIAIKGRMDEGKPAQAIASMPDFNIRVTSWNELEVFDSPRNGLFLLVSIGHNSFSSEVGGS
jgi:hypothetical protein